MSNDKRNGCGERFISFSRSYYGSYGAQFINPCTFVVNGDIITANEKLHPYNFDNYSAEGGEFEERYYGDRLRISSKNVKKIILEINKITELDYRIFDTIYDDDKTCNISLIRNICILAKERGIPVEFRTRKGRLSSEELKNIYDTETNDTEL